MLNIDWLVKEGMLFINVCVMNFICVFFCVVIFIGKYSYINGKIDNCFFFDMINVIFL